MTKSKKRRSNNKRGPKRSSRRNANSRYSLVPLVQRVRLVARSYDTAATAASPVYFRLGLLEPLGSAPVFEAIHFQMYRRARIIRTSITLKLINMAAEPIELIVNAMPYNWTSGSPTLAELIAKRGSKRAIASGATGMDKIEFTNSWSSKELLGRAYALADFDFSYAQAISATPLDIEEPIIQIAISALNASTSISYRLEYVINYDYEFYDQYTV